MMASQLYTRAGHRAGRKGPGRGASRSTADAWSDFSIPSAVLRAASRGASAPEGSTADGSSDFSDPSAVAMKAPRPCAGRPEAPDRGLRSGGEAFRSTADGSSDFFNPSAVGVESPWRPRDARRRAVDARLDFPDLPAAGCERDRRPVLSNRSRRTPPRPRRSGRPGRGARVLWGPWGLRLEGLVCCGTRLSGRGAPLLDAVPGPGYNRLVHGSPGAEGGNEESRRGRRWQRRGRPGGSGRGCYRSAPWSRRQKGEHVANQDEDPLQKEQDAFEAAREELLEDP